MLIPNKLYTYKESVISKFPVILRILSRGDCSVSDLYQRVRCEVSGTSEFVEVLDCLYALHKIEYDDGEEVLRIVN